MSFADLPWDIHKHTVDVVGEEFAAQGVAALFSTSSLVGEKDPKIVLRTFSLVNKYWRSLAAVHLFHEIFLYPMSPNIPGYPSDDRASPYMCLYRVLERNPSLGSSVGVLDEAYIMEKVCKIITPISSLDIVGIDPPIQSYLHPDHSTGASYTPLSSRPLVQSGLRSLMRTPQFRHLSVAGSAFRTSLLEGVPVLESLILSGNRVAVADHQSDSLPVLEKLKLGLANRFMTSLQTTPDIRPFFQNIHHLEVRFEIWTPIQWDQTLAWESLRKLQLSFNSRPDFSTNAELISFVGSMPWSLLQHLEFLKLNVDIRLSPDPSSGSEENAKLATLLSGPARLKNLKELAIGLSIRRPVVQTKDDIQKILHCTFLQGFDRAFRNEESFGALEDFRTQLFLTGRSGNECLAMDRDSLMDMAMSNLPSISRPGGRQEVHGWKTEVMLIWSTLYHTEEGDDDYEALSRARDFSQQEYLFHYL